MIHETAVIDSGAEIGEGTNVWHFSHIRETAKVGSKCNISQNCYIDFDVLIGNGVKLQNNVSVWHGVTIEDDVFVGPSVVFTNDLYPRAFIWEDSRVETTLVKKGCSIGANATIICGSRILGEYSIIAAGSVVTKNVPDFGLVVGNPARLVGFVCKCGHKLEKIDSTDEFVLMKCTNDCKFKDEEYKIKKEDFEKLK